MSEKRYTFECIDNNCLIYEDGIWLKIEEVVELLNEQQATIEMYQRSIERREEQISIIKKYCLKFLTDEQFEIIKKALEDE